MRKLRTLTLIILCLLLTVGCSADQEEAIPQEEEAVTEETVQWVLTLGAEHELDLNHDGETETLTVRHQEVMGASANVNYLIGEESHESVSELPGLERTILMEEYRIIPDESQPILALYTKGKQINEVFFYALDEDMMFTYLGRITGEENFFELGDMESHGIQVILGEELFVMDPSVPSIPLMYQAKDEALDYLGLPVYSIISGFGEPDQTEQLDGEEKLVYLERDLEVYVLEDKIQRVCTTSGIMLGIDVLEGFSEDDWQEQERYELLGLPISVEKASVARFDLDKYFVECWLRESESGWEVVSICVSLSELFQARVKEEHVLVDRFGNLLFAENKDAWTELLRPEDGWLDMAILGYERENAVLFLQATRSSTVSVYHYNLLDNQVNKLVDNPVSADFTGGMLAVDLADARKYYDLGGVDVTEEIMGPKEEEVKVEFYVQSDTLFYFPGATEDYMVLKNLTDYLEKDHKAYETGFEAAYGLGFLEAYRDQEDSSYDLYLFLADEGRLKLLNEGVSDYAIETVDGEQVLLVELESDNDKFACYDLNGSFRGNCDQTGQMVE